MPQDILTRCLRGVPLVRNDNLIVASETFDDAGVYRLTDDLAVVQTVDVFTPVLDDPYWYGAVAAANSLSDVYAMGGVPITVLAILGFPAKLDPEVMTEILTGSADVVRESGAVIAGGHTIVDNELKFGLSVTGTIHPDRVVRNSTARPGDVLVLTKPLGTGFIATGIKKGLVKDEDLVERITRSMVTLNRAAAEAMVEVGVSAATDVTGFGLLGHSLEMAEGSGVTMRFRYADIPIFEEAEGLVATCMCGGTSGNRRHSLEKVAFADGITHEQQMVLFDAQTSGGLLISVPAERLDTLLAALESRGVDPRAVVGEVLPRGEKPLEVV